MIVNISAVLFAGGFIVLVVMTLPILVELRKTLAEARQVLAMLQGEMVPLLREVRSVTEHVNAIADQAQESVEHASTLFRAVGDLGRTLERAQSQLLQQSDRVFSRVSVVGAGLRAAGRVMAQRFTKQRSHTNGR